MKKPLLCRIGLHKPYRYMPRVGGDLGKSVACKRCGYGKREFGGWDIKPESVQEGIKNEVQIAYGHVLSLLPSTSNFGISSQRILEIGYEIIKDDFSEEELRPIKEELDSMRKLVESAVKG